jgi:hypothetical protein
VHATQGQLLGVGGRQLQRIKQESNARVEVVNAQGNLNGELCLPSTWLGTWLGTHTRRSSSSSTLCQPLKTPACTHPPPGAHPDPLDKQLHAHITADSLVSWPHTRRRAQGNPACGPSTRAARQHCPSCLWA